MDYKSPVEIKDIITYLITLYAVVPSIIITVMYSFLSNVEVELSRVWEQSTSDDSSEELQKRAFKVNKFVIVSAKLFHLIMSYYLTLLFAALLSKCIPTSNENVSKVIFVASAIYFSYFILYLFCDIIKSFKTAFNNDFVEKAFVYIYVFLIHGAFPISLPILFTYFIKVDEFYIHTWWITLTIFFLLTWWTMVPLLYKPLTNLSYIMRNS